MKNLFYLFFVSMAFFSCQSSLTSSDDIDSDILEFLKKEGFEMVNEKPESSLIGIDDYITQLQYNQSNLSPGPLFKPSIRNMIFTHYNEDSDSGLTKISKEMSHSLRNYFSKLRNVGYDIYGLDFDYSNVLSIGSYRSSFYKHDYSSNQDLESFLRILWENSSDIKLESNMMEDKLTCVIYKGNDKVYEDYFYFTNSKGKKEASILKSRFDNITTQDLKNADMFSLDGDDIKIDHTMKLIIGNYVFQKHFEDMNTHEIFNLSETRYSKYGEVIFYPTNSHILF